MDAPATRPKGAGLLCLLLFAAVIVIVPLAFPNRWALLLTGMSSAMIVIGLIIGVTVNLGFYLSLSSLGVDLTGDVTSWLLGLLPASVGWIGASFKA